MSTQRYYFCFSIGFFLTFLFFQIQLTGQTITKSYSIPKFSAQEMEYNDSQIKYLTFETSVSSNDFPTLPALLDKIAVNQLYASYTYTLSNAKYESLTSEEISVIPAAYIFSEPKVNIKTTTDEKKYYAMLSIIPIIKNANGQFQKLVSCDIRFEGKNPVSVPRSAGLRNSVLTTGTWYKISVSETGLHKVTYEDLNSLGISVSQLKSANIALYGNGGGAIPDINPPVQTDDLLPVPIMIKDNNGTFDENSYFVFYAQGPHSWEYDENNDLFKHNYNIYSDNAYYFINVDNGVGEKKRVEKKNYNSQTANKTASFFTFYDFYEKDVKNFGETGREWFDDPFSVSTTKTYSFFLPELYNNKGRIKIRVAATSTSSSSMNLTWNGSSDQFSVLGNSSSNFATLTEYSKNNLTFNSGELALKMTLTSSQTSASVNLDYIEIQTLCKLKITGSAMPFTLTENIGTSNISSVTLGNATAQTMVWDVTEHNNVYALERKTSGNQFAFNIPTNQIRNLIAFDGTNYKSVTTVGKVNNQNLHNFKGVDMVIVSHSTFLSEANRLAQFRAKTNGITVKVVTPEQVYNEFSSGAQDPAAIRNFMRYLYDNDEQTIKYLLLFGRPSYDYRGRVNGTQLFIPNWQGSAFPTGLLWSFDDYFGVLGINEGDMNNNTINIAVGRFPVNSTTLAKIVVDKTINASERKKITPQNASQVPNFGDWRNMITLVADDKQGFIYDAESAAKVVNDNYPFFNLDKIYEDAFPVVSYAGGQRYPDATKALNMRMEKGTLAIAYMGHGGKTGWTQERLLEVVDINNWKNKYNQPLMVTVTCSFGWYDKQAISPAELAFFNENGGVSAVITTSRDTQSNETFGNNVIFEIGKKLENRYQTVGEIHKNAKNKKDGTASNTNMIYLMGDPSMIINVPFYDVKTDQILDEEQQPLDTLKALSKITIKGRVTDDEGKTMTNFNGNLYPSVFDKAVKQKTLELEKPVEFLVQKNIIFRGNVTVTKGEFQFSFYVPKDINYEYGNGKISYYAASDDNDAGDYYDNFIIGGMSDKLIEDKTGPEISVYLNDEKFVPGGITNPNPVLLIKLKDEYGINTTGNGIGHDLVAILDNNIEKQMELNDYYLADQDSYNSGTVRYPLYDLEPGAHTLKVRAWDIFNNPSETTLDFVVKSDEKLVLDHVLNYPNPFTTKTEFYFEHNQPMEEFDILIHIFTVSGKLVKTIQEKQFLQGNRSNPIVWNGRDDYGDKIGKGVYIYRLTVRNSQGEIAEKIEKIAIL